MVGEADHERRLGLEGATPGDGRDHEVSPAQRDAPGRQRHRRVAEVAARERHRVLPHGRSPTVHSAHGEPGAGGKPIAFQVETQGVSAEGKGRPRVRHELGKLGEAGPPGPIIVRNGAPDPLPREARDRVHTLAARQVGAVPVADEDAHVIDARANGDELLENDALVPAQGLFERTHAHRLIAGHEPREAGVGAEAEFDVILGDEIVGVAPEGERRIGE